MTLVVRVLQSADQLQVRDLAWSSTRKLSPPGHRGYSAKPPTRVDGVPGEWKREPNLSRKTLAGTLSTMRAWRFLTLGDPLGTLILTRKPPHPRHLSRIEGLSVSHILCWTPRAAAKAEAL
jgi:hypothetical protein